MKQDRIFETPENKRRRGNDEQNDNRSNRKLIFDENDNTLSPLVLNITDRFLMPMLTKNINIKNKIYTIPDNNISDMFNFSLNKYNEYINDNNLNITSDVFKFYMSENIVKNYTYSDNIKNCILIASFLSPLYEFDNTINMDNFILGTDSEKNMIVSMIKLIFNDSRNSSEYMLIPKYITIIDKIGRSGVLSFIDFLQKNHCKNIYDELVKYCNIVLEYQFNDPQITELYNLRRNEIINLYDFLKKNNNASIESIINFLD